MIYEQELSNTIIGCAFTVYNTLGRGFLEKVYENALLIELKNKNLDAVNQYPISVYYNEQVVGEYFADIIVENKVILELKSVEKLNDVHSAQLLNYLKATNIKVGYLLNFGSNSKLEFKRLVY